MSSAERVAEHVAQLCNAFERLAILIGLLLSPSARADPEVYRKRLEEVNALARSFQRRAEQLRGDQPTKRIKRGELGEQAPMHLAGDSVVEIRVDESEGGSECAR